MRIDSFIMTGIGHFIELYIAKLFYHQCTVDKRCFLYAHINECIHSFINYNCFHALNGTFQSKPYLCSCM